MSLAKVCLALLAAMVFGTTPEGLAFLEANGKKEGVVTLASGLQYKALTSAPAGAKSPLVGTPCSCHYRGTLTDGTEFDSSYKRGAPTTFAPNQASPPSTPGGSAIAAHAPHPFLQRRRSSRAGPRRCS